MRIVRMPTTGLEYRDWDIRGKKRNGRRRAEVNAIKRTCYRTSRALCERP